MEDMRNIQPICSGCADERKKMVQENIVDKMHMIDDILGNGKDAHIKMRFQGLKKAEHMWVKVKRIDFNREKIYGNLDNDPFFVEGIKWGDDVELSFGEVEDIMV